jgi:predicted anti-sigma-YlaC factor YlaD
VNCEARQEQVSLLIDGEAGEPDEAAVFRHLGECPDCRLFFDSMIRFRNTARRDREEITRAADEALRAQAPIPRERGRSRPGLGRWLPFLAGGWRVPAPAILGLAVVLLVGGALLGVRLARVSGGAGAEGSAGMRGKPVVVVVCSLPEVEVR